MRSLKGCSFRRRSAREIDLHQLLWRASLRQATLPELGWRPAAAAAASQSRLANAGIPL